MKIYCCYLGKGGICKIYWGGWGGDDVKSFLVVEVLCC